MDIEEIRALKSETEREIKRLLQEFSNKTGCQVVDVETEKQPVGMVGDKRAKYLITWVNLDIEI